MFLLFVKLIFFPLIECHGKSTSEHTGIVKFIGFISGNQTDVYIGVRLDDDGKYYENLFSLFLRSLSFNALQVFFLHVLNYCWC